MAERLKTNSEQNWENRDIMSLGPQWRLDTNNPQIGIDGENVYNLYGVTKNDDQCTLGLTEGGHFRILNDRDVEITAGNKSEEEEVDIALNALKGNITITALGNGSVQIKARNIILDAAEDIDLKAGRNITLTAGQVIRLDAMKIEIAGVLGNLVDSVLGSFGDQVFSGTPVLESENIGTDIIEDLF